MVEPAGEFSHKRFDELSRKGFPDEIEVDDWQFVVDYVAYLHLEIEGLEEANANLS